MKLKKIILLGSLVGTATIFILKNPVELTFCLETEYLCRMKYGIAEETFYIFPIVLLFSVITYNLSGLVFYEWFKFARITVPILVLASLLQSFSIYYPQGFRLIDLDSLLIPFLYTFFILGSIMQILRGYYRK